MSELFAVVCRHPSGHDTILRALVFTERDEAGRAANKRDRHPNAIAFGFEHRVEVVTENPQQTGPNDKYLIAQAAQDDSTKGDE